MGTKLSGIAAAETWDSSNELLRMDGLDISSILDGTAFLNYEHQNTNPTNGCVGKILTGKKIFTEQDCETQDQLKWWKQVQMPFLYIIGELFDEEGHSAAIDIAAMLKYDDKMRKQGLIGKNGLKPIVNFSVEGAKLASKDGVISRSIARKVSVTVLACNKVCEAALYTEEVPQQQPQAKPMTFAEIKNGLVQKGMIKSESTGSLTKAEPLKIAPKPKPIGATSSGKPVHLGNFQDFAGWDHKDHKDAANMHYNAGMKATDPAARSKHMMKVNFHQRMSGKLENRSVAKSNPLEREDLFKQMVKNEDFAMPVWQKVQEFRTWVSGKLPQLSPEDVETLTRLMSNAKWTKAESALKKM